MNLLSIFNKFIGTSERSKEAVKHIILSMIAKSISIICSLLIVPMTINYINPVQYGVWMALSSIIAWISFFDLGLGNGFRNKFTEAKANGNDKLATQYVSTTYFVLGCISCIVFIIVLIVNNFIDWTAVLKVNKELYEELRVVFAIISGFFCLNLTVNIFSMLLTADQKPGYASLISGLGSLISIGVIFLLTKLSTGSLVSLALYFSGIPVLTMLVVSAYSFIFTRYKKYKPRISNINLKLIKNIINLGIKFFIIYFCMLLIFQLINIIISRELGPIYVTQYNIAYKYFNVFYSIWMLFLAPVWSSFTDAYAKGDISWMKVSIKKYEIIWCIFAVFGILLLCISPFFYKEWVGEQVEIPFTLSISMLIFFLSEALAGLYMQSINGIGKIHLQLIIYALFAILSWPLLTFTCKHWGVSGILIVPSFVYFIQAIFGKIQLNLLIKNKASGIFNK